MACSQTHTQPLRTAERVCVCYVFRHVAVTHHSVALLGLQVLLVHLVELVKDGGHYRKTALLSALQD